MKFADRIKEASTVTSTTSIVLAGAKSTFRTFAAAFSVGDKDIPVSVEDLSGNWELGLYTFTDATHLTRQSILSSSNSNQAVAFPAGDKTISCVIPSTFANTVGSTRIVYLSNYCVSDSDLNLSNPVAGVDQRAKIQAVLDLAVAGPLRVVWDVKVTIGNVPDGSGDALRVRSNTEIVALNGCGALHAAGSNGWMISNYNTTTNANNNFAAITDENITIDGGIWNGNRAAQGGAKNDVFHWSGVRNLRTVNYKVVNASGMAHRLINTDGHKNENYEIDFGAGNDRVNTDGMHYHGPARNIRDRNGRIVNCGDDSYALNADDAWGEANFTGRYDNVWGPITDVTITDLYINAAVFGIRLLSGASRIDDIRIRNVRGTTSGYSFLIDNYITPSKASLSGPGNFGSIEVDGWHMVNTFRPSWLQQAMHISAKVEQLSLRNITKGDFNNDLFPIIRLGEKADIDQLTIESFKSKNYNGGTYVTDQIVFASGANIRSAKINGATFDAPSGTGGYPVNVMAGATIRTLQLNGCTGSNFSSLVLNNGTVTNLLVPASTNFMDTASGGGGSPVVSSVSITPSTLSVAGGATQQFTATVNGTNSPSQAVTYSAVNATVNSSGLATFPAATTSAQNATVTATSVADPSKSATAQITIAASGTSPGASTWVLQSNVPWVEDTSNPGNLTYSGPKSGVVGSAKKTTSDAYSGNVKVSDIVEFTGPQPSFFVGYHSALVARASNIVPWSGVQNGYFVDMYLESGGGVKVNKAVAGTQSDISPTVAVQFALNTKYARSMTIKTVSGVTTLTVVIQRVSDGMYLQSNGTWSATASSVFSVTDSSLPAASGEWGVYAYNEGNTGNSIVHTGIAISAAP